MDNDNDTTASSASDEEGENPAPVYEDDDKDDRQSSDSSSSDCNPDHPKDYMEYRNRVVDYPIEYRTNGNAIATENSNEIFRKISEKVRSLFC